MIIFAMGCTICAAIVLMGCGGLSGKQKEAASNAIKALGKIEAAVQVGVNYQQYGQLVIDAKAAVNEAERILPDGELKTSLNAVVEAYADAASVWSQKVEYPRIGIDKAYGIGKALIPKYGIPLDRDKNSAEYATALNTIWEVASTKLAQARSLLK
jgi:hypothetical protein